MALFLKKFDRDLQHKLRIIALSEKITLCSLIEKSLRKALHLPSNQNKGIKT